jgi:hypothetical protein
MPRVQASKPTRNVIHQTIEMPQSPSSEPEGPKPEKPDFWTYMQSLTPDEWKDHIVYITRERPKTSINGLGGYLVKLQQAFDIEDIKAAYGGYDFSYIMKKKNDIAYGGRFTIEADPKYDRARENPSVQMAGQSESANSLASQVASILREQLDHERERNDRPNPATDKVVDLMAEGARQSMQIVKDQVPKAASATGELRELVGAMKDMGIIGATNGGSTLGNLIKELTPLFTFLTPLIEKFLKPQDPLTQLASFKSLIELAGEIGGKGGSRGTTTNDLILEGIKTLPDVVDRMAAQRAATPQERARLMAARAAPTPAVSPQSAPAAAAAAFPTAAAAPAGPMRVVPLDRADVGAPTSPTVSTDAVTPEQYNSWVSARVVEMIYMGFDGEQIVDALDSWKPDVVKDLAKFTEDQITYTFKLDPILIRATEHPNWNAILRQAKQAAAEIVAEDGELEPETEPFTGIGPRLKVN